MAAARATISRIAPVTTAPADPVRAEGAGADDTAESVAAEPNEDTRPS